jgi:hypothetical protein
MCLPISLSKSCSSRRLNASLQVPWKLSECIYLAVFSWVTNACLFVFAQCIYHEKIVHVSLSSKCLLSVNRNLILFCVWNIFALRRLQTVSWKFAPSLEIYSIIFPEQNWNQTHHTGYLIGHIDCLSMSCPLKVWRHLKDVPDKVYLNGAPETLGDQEPLSTEFCNEFYYALYKVSFISKLRCTIITGSKHRCCWTACGAKSDGNMALGKWNKTCLEILRFSTAVTTKIAVFENVTPCNLIHI